MEVAQDGTHNANYRRTKKKQELSSCLRFRGLFGILENMKIFFEIWSIVLSSDALRMLMFFKK